MNRRWERGRDGYSARVRFGANRRQRFRMAVSSDGEAEARAELLAEIASSLAASGHAEHAEVFLKRAAAGDDDEAAEVLELARKLADGRAVVNDRKLDAARTTFRMVAERWVSGELARRYPDHVRKKRTADKDRGCLNKLIPIEEAGLDARALELSAALTVALEREDAGAAWLRGEAVFEAAAITTQEADEEAQRRAEARRGGVQYVALPNPAKKRRGKK